MKFYISTEKQLVVHKNEKLIHKNKKKPISLSKNSSDFTESKGKILGVLLQKLHGRLSSSNLMGNTTISKSHFNSTESCY